MIILIVFSFLAGIVTILSPCILPILPIILATSVVNDNSRKRPLGIVTGFILSFTFFTLFLNSLVKFIGVPSDLLRSLSILVIGFFGISLLIPKFQLLMESLFSRLANLTPNSSGKTGFFGGIIIGLSLGLLWTPCVGPILASVIALAVSGTVTGSAFIITLAYSIGTAIPMFLIIIGGQKIVKNLGTLVRNTSIIQKGFGIVMILTAGALYFGFDRSFQTYVINKFPRYGSGLTKFEEKAFKNLSIPKGDNAPDLIVGGQWFNSSPLLMESLKGKVVLVDFWTYTCINCQRTLPYLKSWYDKYHDKGLVIIGVHSPEFEFEKDGDNVKQAIADFGIKYPVMQDNNFATWRAYKNNYWPAKYLVDKDGIIRFTHFGEGDYDRTEETIQALLRETGVELVDTPKNKVEPTYGRTPETYLGSRRGQNEEYVTYEGTWQKSEEYTSPSAGSKLNLKFDAMKVYLVMRNTGKVANVKVSIDGKFVRTVSVTKDTLYTLVELDKPGSHTLTLEFEDNNAELFAFTFG